MEKYLYLALAFFLGAGLAVAEPKGGQKSFVGNISDSMCGAKHMMPGKSDKECTIECVKGGAKYVLSDAKGKVYDLSDQDKVKDFAGQKVKIAGTLKEKTIEVASVEPAQ